MTFCDKLKILTIFFPIKNKQNLIEKGNKRMDDELDLMRIIKDNRNNAKFISQHHNL